MNNEDLYDICVGRGGLAKCPRCWNDDCDCSPLEMEFFKKEREQGQLEMKIFNDAKHKDPMFEAWELFKKNQKNS